jgi:soluble lytic murein transglycosylase-like protein
MTMAASLDRALLQEVGNHYRLPAHLLAAQVLQESSGDPFAFRFEPNFWRRYIRDNPDAKAFRFGPLAACSFGLLQIMLETAYEIGFDGRPEDLFVPRIGLSWGAKYLRSLWDWAGGEDANYIQALCAYNGGRGGNGTPPFRNQHYADLVYQRASAAVQV